MLEKFTVRLSHSDKLLFAKYLAVLLRAGLAIDDALDILIQQSKGPLKTILTNLKTHIRNGDALADGFADYPHVFTPVFINLIRAGERSGTLQDNLEHLVLQMEKDRNLQQKIRGALAYPIIVLVGALMLSVGIVVFILPNILNVFTTLKVDLPLTTKMLIWLADLWLITAVWRLWLFWSSHFVACGPTPASVPTVFARLLDALSCYWQCGASHQSGPHLSLDGNHA